MRPACRSERTAHAAGVSDASYASVPPYTTRYLIRSVRVPGLCVYVFDFVSWRDRIFCLLLSVDHAGPKR